MDVLAFYMPKIDWEKFSRGTVLKQTWSKFKEVVLLCHAAAHWERKLHTTRDKQPTDALSRSDMIDWEKENARAIHHIEMHMRRANFLATEKILEMGDALPAQYDGSASAKLFVALRASVGIQANDGSAQCVLVCFHEFDATEELAGEPIAIVKRWHDRERPLLAS